MNTVVGEPVPQFMVRESVVFDALDSGLVMLIGFHYTFNMKIIYYLNYKRKGRRITWIVLH